MATLGKWSEGSGSDPAFPLERVVGGNSVVMVTVVRLLGSFQGAGAMLERMLLTRLPIPIQKAMTSPASRPTMAPGGLAQGKNIPRQKSPSSGPPTMPKMLIAACSTGPIWEEI